MSGWPRPHPRSVMDRTLRAVVTPTIAYQFPRGPGGHIQFQKTSQSLFENQSPAPYPPQTKTLKIKHVWWKPPQKKVGAIGAGWPLSVVSDTPTEPKKKLLVTPKKKTVTPRGVAGTMVWWPPSTIRHLVLSWTPHLQNYCLPGFVQICRHLLKFVAGGAWWQLRVRELFHWLAMHRSTRFILLSLCVECRFW